MCHKTVSISKAKAKLLELTKKVNSEGLAYLLTKDGEPVSALVPLEDYAALLESMDVTSNTEIMKDLKAALEDERKGNLWKRNSSGKWTKVKKKPLKSSRNS